MPPKDSATELLYRIIDGVTGVDVNYNPKTNTITYTEPKIAICDKAITGDSDYVSRVNDHLCSQCENWKQKEEETKMKNDTKPAPVYSPFAIRSVLSNRKKNAFSVVWMDGTTTVVHCQPGDEWDDEKALAMCFTKKALGNKGNFNNKFNDALDNKMKVIPIEKKTIPAREKCDCDNTCTECKCEKENTLDHLVDTMKEVQEGANKATDSLTEMVNTLVDEANKTEKSKEYKVYLYSVLADKKTMHLATLHTVQEVRDFVKEYSKEVGHGWYFRTWNAIGSMYVDYGSYTYYLLVEGMDNSEYGKK